MIHGRRRYDGRGESIMIGCIAARRRTERAACLHLLSVLTLRRPQHTRAHSQESRADVECDHVVVNICRDERDISERPEDEAELRPQR